MGGTCARGTGAGSAPDAARPGHKLIAVVAETPRGTRSSPCICSSCADSAS